MSKPDPLTRREREIMDILHRRVRGAGFFIGCEGISMVLKI